MLSHQPTTRRRSHPILWGPTDSMVGETNKEYTQQQQQQHEGGSQQEVGSVVSESATALSTIVVAQQEQLSTTTVDDLDFAKSSIASSASSPADNRVSDDSSVVLVVGQNMIDADDKQVGQLVVLPPTTPFPSAPLVTLSASSTPNIADATTSADIVPVQLFASLTTTTTSQTSPPATDDVVLVPSRFLESHAATLDGDTKNATVETIASLSETTTSLPNDPRGSNSWPIVPSAIWKNLSSMELRRRSVMGKLLLQHLPNEINEIQSFLEGSLSSTTSTTRNSTSSTTTPSFSALDRIQRHMEQTHKAWSVYLDQLIQVRDNSMWQYDADGRVAMSSVSNQDFNSKIQKSSSSRRLLRSKATPKAETVAMNNRNSALGQLLSMCYEAIVQDLHQPLQEQVRRLGQDLIQVQELHQHVQEQLRLVLSPQVKQIQRIREELITTHENHIRKAWDIVDQAATHRNVEGEDDDEAMVTNNSSPTSVLASLTTWMSPTRTSGGTVTDFIANSIHGGSSSNTATEKKADPNKVRSMKDVWWLEMRYHLAVFQSTLTLRDMLNQWDSLQTDLRHLVFDYQCSLQNILVNSWLPIQNGMVRLCSIQNGGSLCGNKRLMSFLYAVDETPDTDRIQQDIQQALQQISRRAIQRTSVNRSSIMNRSKTSANTSVGAAVTDSDHLDSTLLTTFDFGPLPSVSDNDVPGDINNNLNASSVSSRCVGDLFQSIWIRDCMLLEVRDDSNRRHHCWKMAIGIVTMDQVWHVFVLDHFITSDDDSSPSTVQLQQNTVEYLSQFVANTSKPRCVLNLAQCDYELGPHHVWIELTARTQQQLQQQQQSPPAVPLASTSSHGSSGSTSTSSSNSEIKSSQSGTTVPVTTSLLARAPFFAANRRRRPNIIFRLATVQDNRDWLTHHLQYEQKTDGAENTLVAGASSDAIVDSMLSKESDSAATMTTTQKSSIVLSRFRLFKTSTTEANPTMGSTALDGSSDDGNSATDQTAQSLQESDATTNKENSELADQSGSVKNTIGSAIERSIIVNSVNLVNRRPLLWFARSSMIKAEAAEPRHIEEVANTSMTPTEPVDPFPAHTDNPDYDSLANLTNVEQQESVSGEETMGLNHIAAEVADDTRDGQIDSRDAGYGSIPTDADIEMKSTPTTTDEPDSLPEMYTSTEQPCNEEDVPKTKNETDLVLGEVDLGDPVVGTMVTVQETLSRETGEESEGATTACENGSGGSALRNEFGDTSDKASQPEQGTGSLELPMDVDVLSISNIRPGTHENNSLPARLDASNEITANRRSVADHHDLVNLAISFSSDNMQPTSSTVLLTLAEQQVANTDSNLSQGADMSFRPSDDALPLPNLDENKRVGEPSGDAMLDDVEPHQASQLSEAQRIEPKSPPRLLPLRTQIDSQWTMTVDASSLQSGDSPEITTLDQLKPAYDIPTPPKSGSVFSMDSTDSQAMKLEVMHSSNRGAMDQSSLVVNESNNYILSNNNGGEIDSKSDSPIDLLVARFGVEKQEQNTPGTGIDPEKVPMATAPIILSSKGAYPHKASLTEHDTSASSLSRESSQVVKGSNSNTNGGAIVATTPRRFGRLGWLARSAAGSRRTDDKSKETSAEDDHSLDISTRTNKNGPSERESVKWDDNTPSAAIKILNHMRVGIAVSPGRRWMLGKFGFLGQPSANNMSTSNMAQSSSMLKDKPMEVGNMATVSINGRPTNQASVKLLPSSSTASEPLPSVTKETDSALVASNYSMSTDDDLSLDGSERSTTSHSRATTVRTLTKSVQQGLSDVNGKAAIKSPARGHIPPRENLAVHQHATTLAHPTAAPKQSLILLVHELLRNSDETTKEQFKRGEVVATPTNTTLQEIYALEKSWRPRIRLDSANSSVQDEAEAAERDEESVVSVHNNEKRRPLVPVVVELDGEALGSHWANMALSSDEHNERSEFMSREYQNDVVGIRNNEEKHVRDLGGRTGVVPFEEIEGEGLGRRWANAGTMSSTDEPIDRDYRQNRYYSTIDNNQKATMASKMDRARDTERGLVAGPRRTTTASRTKMSANHPSTSPLMVDFPNNSNSMSDSRIVPSTRTERSTTPVPSTTTSTSATTMTTTKKPSLSFKASTLPQSVRRKNNNIMINKPGENMDSPAAAAATTTPTTRTVTSVPTAITTATGATTTKPTTTRAASLPLKSVVIHPPESSYEKIKTSHGDPHHSSRPRTHKKKKKRREAPPLERLEL